MNGRTKLGSPMGGFPKTRPTTCSRTSAVECGIAVVNDFDEFGRLNGRLRKYNGPFVKHFWQ